MIKKQSSLISPIVESRAVKIINEYYDNRGSGDDDISADYLRDNMPDVDVDHLVDVLVAKGIIKHEAVSLSSDKGIIRLAPCITYFEDKAEAASKTRADRTHDWLIAIFSAMAGALISEPLWSLIHSLF